MTLRKLQAGLLASLVAFAPVATNATEYRTLPTPEASDAADTESSVNVPLADWPDLGRRVAVALSAYATPSNAVQIAFGQDSDGDENLEPEETAYVIGVDCGEWFMREEGGQKFRGQIEELVNPSQNQLLATNQLTTVFRFRQPSRLSDRFSFAKVTTWGKVGCAASIAVEINKPGIVLLLR